MIELIEEEMPVGARIKVIGVGGAGMRAIASVLAAMGHEVSGSDLKESGGLDRLRAEGVDLENFQRVSVRIYSAANNQLVFSANDMSGWDGRDLSGQPCPDGYYFYALEAVTHQNRTITRGQTVRLFR